MVNKGLFCIFGLLFLLLRFVSGGEVAFIDSESGEIINDVIAKLDLTDESTKEAIKKIIYVKDKNLELAESNYYGSIALDKTSTDVPDYYFSGSFEVSSEKTDLAFVPAAKLSGNVYDNLENLVKSELSFKCDRLSYIEFPSETAVLKKRILVKKQDLRHAIMGALPTKR